MSPVAPSAIVTRTWTGTVRLRNARELEQLWWWPNTVRNAPDEFDATRFGRRLVGGICDDFTRRYTQPGTPAPSFRPGWKLRSVAVKDARLTWRANRRDAVLRVQGLPALRVRLHRPVPDGAATRGTIRIVRRQRRCRGRVPARYEIRIMVDVPTREPCTEAHRLRGWDPGGRRALTSDAGDVVRVLPRERTATRRLARRILRCKRGSRGWRKAKAALRLHLERETRAREQHRHKQAHHAAAKADVHVVEANRALPVRPCSSLTGQPLEEAVAAILGRDHPGLSWVVLQVLDDGVVDARLKELLLVDEPRRLGRVLQPELDGDDDPLRGLVPSPRGRVEYRHFRIFSEGWGIRWSYVCKSLRYPHACHKTPLETPCGLPVPSSPVASKPMRSCASFRWAEGGES